MNEKKPISRKLNSTLKRDAKQKGSSIDETNSIRRAKMREITWKMMTIWLI
jgi:hypothetical protein